MSVFSKTRARISSFGEAVVQEFDRQVKELNCVYGSIRFLTCEGHGPENEQALKQEWVNLLDLSDWFCLWLKTNFGLHSSQDRPCAVELLGKLESVIVNGHTIPAIARKQFEVISLLRKAYPNGITKGVFERKWCLYNAPKSSTRVLSLRFDGTKTCLGEFSS